jgi:uncharacterized protein (TIGR03437 family)
LPAGTYQGSIQIKVPNGTPATFSIAVTFVVGATLPPKLSVDSPRLSLSTSVGGSAAAGLVAVNNIGGGVLAFSVAAGTDSGGNWLTGISASGTASPAAPASVVVTANPGSLAAGVYTGRIAITSATSGEQASVPVTMIVGAAQSRILLSASGMSFQAVAGAGPPPAQNLSILNRGQGSLTWNATAQALTGNSTWLSISAGTGTVSRPLLDASPVSVNVDAANLAPGLYYGRITVSNSVANSAGNSGAQSVTVVLSVVDAASAPSPQTQPVGLIFTGRSGTTPGSQDLLVRNSGVAPLAFNSAQLTLDGAAWLQYVPSNANVPRSQVARIAVQPGSLPAGVYDGSITLLFEDDTITVARVKTVIAPANCTPTHLVMLPTNVEQFFTATRYLPLSINVRVVDDCGLALTADRTGASLTMSFSNGDRTVSLVPVGSGNWSATWQPAGTSPGPVFITLTATLPVAGKQPLAGSADLEADVAGSVNIPVASALLNAGSFAVDAPVAPGSLVSLFGSHLADTSATAPGLPLGTSLANTQVRLGDTLLPLVYASDGQINAQVPFDVAVNAELALSVTRGTSISVPQQIVTATAAPGAFTRDQSGAGPGLIVDGVTNVPNDANHPARVGDTVVIYCTGLGSVTPLPPNGQGAGGAASTDNPVTMTIGGRPAQVAYAGLTPGFPGLYQINVVVPAGVSPGNSVAVVASLANASSSPVTMVVR